MKQCSLQLSVVLAFALCVSGQTQPAADLIVQNARVWTVNPSRPEADAVAVLGDRIVAVGSSRQVDAWRGPHTRVIDAAGMRLLPGFNDAHVHFADGGSQLDNVQLNDANQNIESETDGNKHTTKYEYNTKNLPIKITKPNGDTTETGYDAEGKKTSYTDGNSHTWEYKRNKLEQVTEEKNPLSKIWKKTYNKAGGLETLEDPEKHTTTYSYDESNRLGTIKYSTGKPSEVTYSYNKDSKVTKMKDETGTTENTWDKLDRLTEYKNGAGKTVKYEYSVANLPVKITYPNGKSVAREYDKDNRLSKVTP